MSAAELADTECRTCHDKVIENDTVHVCGTCETIVHTDCVKNVYGVVNPKKFPCHHDREWVCGKVMLNKNDDDWGEGDYENIRI